MRKLWLPEKEMGRGVTWTWWSEGQPSKQVPPDTVQGKETTSYHSQKEEEGREGKYKTGEQTVVRGQRLPEKTRQLQVRERGDDQGTFTHIWKVKFIVTFSVWSPGLGQTSFPLSSWSSTVMANCLSGTYSQVGPRLSLRSTGAHACWSGYPLP